MAKKPVLNDDEDTTPPAEGVLIKSIGPISELSLPCPKDGGLVVLRGANGSGKSEALSTIGAILGNKDNRTDLRPHDGTEAGKAEAWGMVVKVGRSNRQHGELEVFSLTDRLEIGDLVDPGLKGAPENDAKRLKALIKVAAAKADIKLFAELLEEDGMKLVPPGVASNPDLITMATGIKSLADKEALRCEEARDAAIKKRDIAKGGAEGIDTENTPHDETELQTAYRNAVALESRLQSEKAAYDEARQKQAEAQRQLDEARTSYRGPTLHDAHQAWKAAVDLREQAGNEVARLQAELLAAEQVEREAINTATALLTVRDNAESHESTMATWQQTINDAIPEDVDEDELAAANAAVEAAQLAMSRGQDVRNALQKLAEAAVYRTEAKGWDAKAERWRGVAKGVDGVLTNVVKTLGVPISVGMDDNGKTRLLVHHEGREKDIYFADLSVGEKWDVVIPIAVKSLGKGGVFVLPQEGYEGLDPDNRQHLVELLVKHKVVCYTAEPARGDLKVVEMTNPAQVDEVGT